MPKLKQTVPPHGKPKNRTAAEAARLGISEDKLSELVKKGIVPVIKLGHSTHLFDPETTDAALLGHAARNQKAGEAEKNAFGRCFTNSINSMIASPPGRRVASLEQGWSHIKKKHPEDVPPAMQPPDDPQ